MIDAKVFAREHGAKYYSLVSYFLSKIMVEIPFQVLFPWIMGSIVYWMCGLQPDAGKYFILVGIIMLCSVAGFSLGIFFASVFPSLPIALAATPLVLLPLMLFSGIFVNQDSIPGYFNWIKYLSPMKYGFEALAKNEFTGLIMPSGSHILLYYSYLAGTDGKDLHGDTILNQLGIGANDNLSIGICAIILGAMCLVLGLVAYLSLSRVVRIASKTVHFHKAKGKKCSEVVIKVE